MIFLLIFLASLACSESKLLTLSISATCNETCMLDAEGELPLCCSLLQFSNATPSLSSRHSIKLVFHPGEHVVSLLQVSNISYLKLCNWDENQEVIIKGRIAFKDIGDVVINSIHFESTTLELRYRNMKKNLTTIVILNSIFAKSAYKAISIENRDKDLKVVTTIQNSMFSSNWQGIVCNRIASVEQNISLLIANTTFINTTSFSNKFRAFEGGALNILGVELKIHKVLFINNTASKGGAILAQTSTLNITETDFLGNFVDKSGGAIYAIGSVLKVKECIFKHNFAQLSGGAIYSPNSRAVLENNLLEYNSALSIGGAIHFTFSTVIIDKTVFNSNSGSSGGASFFSRSSVFITNNSLFNYNSALLSGGAMSAEINYAIEVENTAFQGNFANRSGGSVYADFVIIRHCQFKNNTAGLSGGALHLDKESTNTTTIQNCSFKSNHAGENGGAMFCANPFFKVKKHRITLSGGSYILNTAKTGGALHISHMCNGSVLGNFHLNKAYQGGAIYAQEISLLLYLPVNITNNLAMFGGGVFLDNSQISIHPASRASLRFSNNAAVTSTGKGGAIFVHDDYRYCENTQQQCFIDTGIAKATGIHVTFANNSAAYGSVLYGGLLDRCSLKQAGIRGIDYFKLISMYKKSSLAITSNPVKLCQCSTYKYHDCSTRDLNVTKMRGEKIELSLTAVDQNNNVLASIIKAGYAELSAELKQGESRKELNGKCNKIFYHIFTVDSSTTLILQPEGPCERSPLSAITIHISIVPCSHGFEQDNEKCVCDRRLVKHLNVTNDLCDINTQYLHRKGPHWLRYDEETLKMHTNCPLDYCNVTSESFSLLQPDEQCANSRSGVLCGGCQNNSLGSSKCLRCTSKFTFIWLTVVFAVAGIALVSLLLVCNMTISAGTMNGLIFYANVVSISGLTSLHNCSLHPILSVFIAWVNLDFGVEVCFFSSMDTYQKTWLQFAFPLYIWLLVGIIIVASYYSSTAMKIFGRNNIAILATLFLLSYNKLLKTIVTALSFTHVLVSKASSVSAPVNSYKVWTYDGNLEYLKGKHIILFLVALLWLIFLFLPYTLLLLFGQCLRSTTVRNRWIAKVLQSTAFVSIMDAYHAPFKPRHRYWVGLLMLICCVLFLSLSHK